MNHEEELFAKRLKDLADKADRRQIAVFSDFLNLNELNIFHSIRSELKFVSCELYGGYEHAERQIIAFIPDALSYQITIPITCIRVRPLNVKFADKLTHRDYLGALLNLGIERSVLGDILVEETCAWIFCLDKIADFICGELSRVKHTAVIAEIVDADHFEYHPNLEKIQGSVASVRLDALISLAYHGSRSSMSGLIEGGKVFVNGKMITSNAYHPKENDLISVRGMGRFRFLGVGKETKKGRIFAQLEKYI